MDNSPRYLKATFLTVLATCVLPALFYFSAISDAGENDIGPGPIQGFYILSAVFIYSIVYATIVFPLLALHLHSNNELTKSNFLIHNLILLGSIALFLGLVIGLLANSIYLIFTLTFPVFLLSAILTIPFTFLWIWLAK